MPRGGAFCLPSVQVRLVHLREFGALFGEPVLQFDGDGDCLFGPQEGSSGDFVHLVHAALVVPADVSAGDVAVIPAGDPVEGLFGPVAEPCAEFIASRQRIVFDQ